MYAFFEVPCISSTHSGVPIAVPTPGFPPQYPLRGSHHSTQPGVPIAVPTPGFPSQNSVLGSMSSIHSGVPITVPTPGFPSQYPPRGSHRSTHSRVPIAVPTLGFPSQYPFRGSMETWVFLETERSVVKWRTCEHRHARSRTLSLDICVNCQAVILLLDVRAYEVYAGIVMVWCFQKMHIFTVGGL